MGLICIVFLICAIRTNVILIMVLLPLPFTFCFLAAAFFYGAEANLTKSAKMEQIGGGFAFVTCMFGWYLFFALMFASIDFPIQLPGKLSPIFRFLEFQTFLFKRNAHRFDDSFRSFDQDQGR